MTDDDIEFRNKMAEIEAAAEIEFRTWVAENEAVEAKIAAMDANPAAELSIVRQYCRIIDGRVGFRGFAAVPDCMVYDFGAARGLSRALSKDRPREPMWSVIFGPDGVMWHGDADQAKLDLAKIILSDFELEPSTIPPYPGQPQSDCETDPFPHRQLEANQAALRRMFAAG